MHRIFEKNTLTSLHKVVHRKYFPRSEFHCRFPSLFAMDEPVRWNRYHRSNFNNIDGSSRDSVKFLGNQKEISGGMYPKTGNFYNPFYFEDYKKMLLSIEKKANKGSKNADWYNRILLRQKAIAAYIVNAVKERNPEFRINSDNAYPCVLFTIPKPPAEKCAKIWTEFLGLYLVAIANKLAYESGLNVEMIRRSGFGHLRPSVAECGESLRINLGLIPKAYADCVVDAILYLNRLFKNPETFGVGFEDQRLSKMLEQYNHRRSFGKKTINIRLRNTLWDTLWAPGDCSSRSFASQIFRNAVAGEYLIDQILKACLERPLDVIFSDKALLIKTFANPVKTVLTKMRMNPCSRITIDIGSDKLTCFSWKKARVIQDENFWTFTADLAKQLGATAMEIRDLTREGILEDLHSRFEILQMHFTFQPEVDENAGDNAGSDSEEEGILDSQPVYAKKMITATGMRGIQLAYAVSRLFLHEQYGMNPQALVPEARQMYYETAQALERYAIPLQKEDKKYQEKGEKLTFFDINHCNAKHEKNGNVLDFVEENSRICVLDITSASNFEVRHTLAKLFRERAKLAVILTLSSGLKQEQAMGDYNPYGTVRIFSRNSVTCDFIHRQLLALEKAAKYEHPRESHLIRKTAKNAGMTLCNAAILRATHEDTDLPGSKF